MTHKEEWAKEIHLADDTCNQRWNDEQADQWKSILWDQHKDHTVLQLKLQSASMFKVSRIWSQDVWMQEQAEMHLLCAESSLEALFLQTDSRHVKMWSMSRHTQSLWFSMS